MKLIKLISTKVRRQKDYSLDINWGGEFLHTMIGKSIHLKAFGLFWVSYIKYSFNIKNEETVKQSEFCGCENDAGTYEDEIGHLYCKECKKLI